jgi:hypothetical protein
MTHMHCDSFTTQQILLQYLTIAACTLGGILVVYIIYKSICKHNKVYDDNSLTAISVCLIYMMTLLELHKWVSCATVFISSIIIIFPLCLLTMCVV